MLDNGLDDTTNTMRRGSDDTCTFLKDVSDNIHHLFVKNYEELTTNLEGVLKSRAKLWRIFEENLLILLRFNLGVPQHIYLDVMDTSEINVLYDLERIFNNTPQVVTLFGTLQKLDKELRFNAAQLRDCKYLKSISIELVYLLFNFTIFPFVSTARREAGCKLRLYCALR